MPAHHDTDDTDDTADTAGFTDNDADIDATFGLRVVRHDDPRIVELWGELDVLAAHQLSGRLPCLLPEKGRRLVADLSAVTFLDCSGLSMLLRVQQRLHTQEATLTLVTNDPFLLRIIRIVGLADVLHIVADLDTALDEPPHDVPA
ncbi:STAS domain-containing protein [Streptomyces sp. VRA16 Mangrove soil]|uniref:STAS domain-containing protein n=1 Tax=Streptomyces sp. VRA16 Mangrove soil TaxID=2817434 RepID=UPI001A9F9D87|nr:STAS domain-containing protein [Streptomyces sp. VRA16 Mangrove soil]MBO1333020.1 STAS domain-containing protein [Streptomyces sp. VRA16 Mangrove soil]